MPYLLEFTNPYGERFYFVAFGLFWPHRPEKRLIGETTRNREMARHFETEAAAEEVLWVVGKPAGWKVVPDA